MFEGRSVATKKAFYEAMFTAFEQELAVPELSVACGRVPTMTPPPTFRFILVPGFWLGAWAWDRVASLLAGTGHDVRAVTLPGLEAVDAPRAALTLDDHVAAVVRVLQEPTTLPTVLVGHSGAGAVVYAATDRLPQLVHHTVYVDSGPLPEGAVGSPDLDPAVAELPLPAWVDLEAGGSSLAGLDEAALAEFRRRAVPHPAGPARDALHLHDPRRYDVPITLVSSSLRPDDIRALTASGHPWFVELAQRQFTILDLPTGHWPMWSRPDDLAEALVRAAVSDRDRATRRPRHAAAP